MAKTIKGSNWLRSLIINAVIAVTVILCTHMVYETNDDFAIASRIVEGYPEVFFINYYYCALLIKIQTLFPSANVHIICQLVLSFASFVYMLKSIMDRNEDIVIRCLAVSVIALFSIDHYCTVQFSKTAALITAAGTMMIIDALTDRSGKAAYAAGIFFVLMGACLRIEGVIVPLGFAAIYAIKWMMDNSSGLKPFLVRKKAAVCLALIAVIGGSGLLYYGSYRANSSTPELREYVEYNDLRSIVIDYSRLDYYEEQKDEYDKAGLSANDISLIKGWVFDYDGSASRENLETIINISDGADAGHMTVPKAAKQFVRSTMKSVRSLDAEGIHIIALALLGLWLLAVSPRSGKLFVILTALAAAVLHLMLFYIERPAYRAMYVPDICAALYMLYAAADLRDLKKAGRVTAVIIAVLMFVMAIPVCTEAEALYRSNASRTMEPEFMEYLENHKDSFCVIATREKKLNPSYMTPLKAPDTESEMNFMGTGSWGTKSPYLYDKLGRYGMTNPIRDLIDNDHAYYAGSNSIDAMTEYYNKWYGSSDREIYLEQAGEAGGIKLWKVRSRETLQK